MIFTVTPCPEGKGVIDGKYGEGTIFSAKNIFGQPEVSTIVSATIDATRSEVKFGTASATIEVFTTLTNEVNCDGSIKFTHALDGPKMGIFSRHVQKTAVSFKEYVEANLSQITQDNPGSAPQQAPQQQAALQVVQMPGEPGSKGNKFLIKVSPEPQGAAIAAVDKNELESAKAELELVKAKNDSERAKMKLELELLKNDSESAKMKLELELLKAKKEKFEREKNQQPLPLPLPLPLVQQQQQQPQQPQQPMFTMQQVPQQQVQQQMFTMQQVPQQQVQQPVQQLQMNGGAGGMMTDEQLQQQQIQQQQQQQQQQQLIQQQQHEHMQGQAKKIIPGWEERQNQEGRTYFVNHADKSTSWSHPGFI